MNAHPNNLHCKVPPRVFSLIHKPGPYIGHISAPPLPHMAKSAFIIYLSYTCPGFSAFKAERCVASSMAAAATYWNPRIYYGLLNLRSLEGAGPCDVISCPADAVDGDTRLEHKLLVLDTVGAAKTEHVGLEATTKIRHNCIPAVRLTIDVLAELNGRKKIGEDVYWKDVHGTWGGRNTWWTRFHDPTTLAWSEWVIWKHVPVNQRFQ